MTVIEALEQDVLRYLFEIRTERHGPKKYGLSVLVLSPCKEPGKSAEIAERLASHLQAYYPMSIEAGVLLIKKYPFWYFESHKDCERPACAASVTFHDFPDDLGHFRKVHRKHFDIVLMLDGYEYSHALGS